MGPPDSSFVSDLPDRVSEALNGGPEEIQRLKIELEAEVAALLGLISETVRALTDVAEALASEAAVRDRD